MTKKYCEEYDSYYDSELDVWSEENCDDKNCGFCKDRPSKPSGVKK